jgi:hypothetical protein
VIIIPIIIAITGPPMMGKYLPSKYDGMAMNRQSTNPGQFFLIKFIYNILLESCGKQRDVLIASFEAFILHLPVETKLKGKTPTIMFT